MTEPIVSGSFDPNTVRKVVNVRAPQMVAWEVFIGKMGAWWPLAFYKIGKATAVDAVLEPHVGGRRSEQAKRRRQARALRIAAHAHQGERPDTVADATSRHTRTDRLDLSR